jgi:galactose-1-phosphate uridylyltransferase
MSRDTANLTPQQIQQLNTALFEDWDAKTQEMKKNAAAANVTTVDPKDIGVSFGPVMDEATFRKYQERKQGRMKVMKAEDLMKMLGKK